MSTIGKSYQPLQQITIRAAANLTKARFINYHGTMCEVGDSALGVTEVDYLSGEAASIITFGIVLVESSGPVNCGDKVTTGLGGVAVSGEANTIGYSLDSGSNGSLIRVKLIV